MTSWPPQRREQGEEAEDCRGADGEIECCGVLVSPNETSGLGGDNAPLKRGRDRDDGEAGHQPKRQVIVVHRRGLAISNQAGVSPTTVVRYISRRKPW